MRTHQAGRRLLRIPDAATYLGTSERHVRRLVSERRLPHHKVGKFVVLDTRDLDAFVAAHRVEATN